MEQHAVTISQIAEAVESTYEHARKVVKGLAFPSKPMLRTISELLRIERTELEKLSLEDRLNHKFGKAAASMGGRNPELQELEIAWPYLSEQHKKDIIEIARLWSRLDPMANLKRAK
ncbi:MAG: hypothetical protein AB7O65_06405 [Candidatus Korobacteraceae bacterium]